MSITRTEALVAGHICLDIIPTLSRNLEFEPGRLVEAGRAVLSTGGAVSNTGLALHRLGVPVQLMGKVGDDLFGSNVRALLDQREPGLGGRMRVTPGEFTSYTVVINLSGADRMFLHAPGCNDTFVSADVPDEALRSCRLLHFGYPPLMARMFADSGEQLVNLFSRAKAAGVTTSLDMSLPDADAPSGRAPWREILARVLPLTDVFLPSLEELLYMLDPDAYREAKLAGDLESWSPEALADESIALGAKVVAVKAGSRGLFVQTATCLAGMGHASGAEWEGLTHWEPCFQVDVAGTTGAGDATIAGFLMGLLRGFPLVQAAEAAVAVGACCCETPDATSGVRTWDETRSRIEQGWAKLTP
jgi:sugar/nucleoside kinase (ribokinase family)